MLCLTYCLFYSQEPPCLPHHQHLVLQKWAWFERNVGVIKISCALHAVMSLAPLTFNIFLCLWPDLPKTQSLNHTIIKTHPMLHVLCA